MCGKAGLVVEVAVSWCCGNGGGVASLVVAGALLVKRCEGSLLCGPCLPLLSFVLCQSLKAVVAVAGCDQGR